MTDKMMSAEDHAKKIQALAAQLNDATIGAAVDGLRIETNRIEYSSPNWKWPVELIAVEIYRAID